MLREILINIGTHNISFGAGVEEARNIGETIKYATIVIATLPILSIYPLLQKYFVKSVFLGAVKG